MSTANDTVVNVPHPVGEDEESLVACHHRKAVYLD
jgi:hypothetical protein